MSSKNPLVLTSHAQTRLHERAVDPAAVEAAMHWGHSNRTRGSLHFHLGKKNIEWARRHGEDLSRYLGTHVVTNGDGVIITVYRTFRRKSLRPRQRRRQVGSQEFIQGPRFSRRPPGEYKYA